MNRQKRLRSSTKVDANVKRRRLFVQRQLEAIDPRILSCICEPGKTIDELTQEVEFRIRASKTAQMFSEDYRLTRAKTEPSTLIDTHELNDITIRGEGKYAFILPQKLIILKSSLTDEIYHQFKVYQDRVGVGSVQHVADIIKAVRSIVELPSIEKFMVGKSSHFLQPSPTTRGFRLHAHAGMVNRFKKYKPSGYQCLYGVMMLSERLDSSAERTTLRMEDKLYEEFEKLYPNKFDSELSGSTAGGLVIEDNVPHYFTLYIAVRFKSR